MVQVFSPGDVESALDFEIRVSSPASPESVSSVSHIVNIVPRIGGTISISDDGCTMAEVLPGVIVKWRLLLRTRGIVNRSLAWMLRIFQNGQLLIIEMMYFSLQPGSSSEAMAISCSIAEGASSDLFAEVAIHLMIDDWSPGYVNFNLKSGTIYSWENGNVISIKRG